VAQKCSIKMGETSRERNVQRAKRPVGETFTEWAKRPGGKNVKRQRGETAQSRSDKTVIVGIIPETVYVCKHIFVVL